MLALALALAPVLVLVLVQALVLVLVQALVLVLVQALVPALAMVLMLHLEFLVVTRRSAVAALTPPALPMQHRLRRGRSCPSFHPQLVVSPIRLRLLSHLVEVEAPAAAATVPRRRTPLLRQQKPLRRWTLQALPIQFPTRSTQLSLPTTRFHHHHLGTMPKHPQGPLWCEVPSLGA